MKFNKIGIIGGVWGCPPCSDDENIPNYLCDPCDSVVLKGGIKGWIAKKCSYTFADITSQAEWETAIANKDVFGRVNGNRILGELPDATFNTVKRGSCGQEEVVKQSRVVPLEDVENDSDFTIDELYNELAKKYPNYDFAFVTCDDRLIGFYSNVAVKTWALSPNSNEEDFKWKSEFSYEEQIGDFTQYQLDFLGEIVLNVCWIVSITVTGEGGAITVPNGSDLQMLAAILPLNATDPTVAWSVVPGTGTATIDANGLLTGTGIGTVSVVATANDAGAVVGTLEITVV